VIDIGNKYIHVEESGQSHGKPSYELINTKSKSTLGEIEYYPPWRCYVFQPMDYTEYNAGCLEAIAKFIKAPSLYK